jgi:hypothetical protein
MSSRCIQRFQNLGITGLVTEDYRVSTITAGRDSALPDVPLEGSKPAGAACTDQVDAVRGRLKVHVY